MYYQPPRTVGLATGVVFTLWAAVLAVVLLDFGLNGEAEIRTFIAAGLGALCAVLALLFAYWTYALATLWYAVDRNGLVIHWGMTRQVIPLQAIRRLVPGTSAGVPRVRGISWLGYHIGKGRLDRVGDVLFYSTHHNPEQVLYVVTDDRHFAISVPDPVEFALEIHRRQDLGPTANVVFRAEHTAASLQAFWHDRRALTFAMFALLACIALWVYVAARWAGLPPTISIHFPAAEALSLIPVASRDMVLEIARAGAAILVVNLLLGIALHLWERPAGYLLLLSAGAFQVVLVVAFQLALSNA